MDAAFDAAAQRYDAWFTHSPTGKLQRERVHYFLQQHMLTGGPKRILELNCGTGEDAVWMAQQGHHVTATDVSSAMLTIARQKAQAAGLADRINVAPLDLTAPQLSAKGGPFDLVFSNFGGLNCIDPDQFRALSAFLADQLNPGGKFISVIMPTSCRWEQLYFLLKGKRKQAFRRKTNDPLGVVVDGSEVPTWYYDPHEVSRFCGDHFRRRKHRAIGYFLPPSYLDPFFEHKPALLNFLNRLEKSIGGFFYASDHFFIELERT